MKTVIRPEAEMKDSGTDWIGEIPNSWKNIPLKRIIIDRAGGAWGSEPCENNSIICMRIADFDFDRGVFQNKNESELTRRSYEQSQVNKLLLQTNDICIEKSGGGEKTPVGRAVLFDKAYDALFANFMDRIRIDSNIAFPKYVEYYLRAMYFLSATTLYIKQTTGIQNLNLTSLLQKEVITIPSISEQQAIADYLDETCSKIDEIIAEAKASIEEYKELKQSIIFEAVTKGLDKNVEMKAVNLEYLDSCPIDWNILPISMLFDFFGGFAYKSDRFCEETNNQVLRLGNVKDNELRLNSNPVYVSDKYANDSSKAAIRVDDILFTMTGTIGKGDYFYTLIITEDDLKEKNLFLNQRVGCFRKAYHTVYMPYYNYLLKSSKIRERVFLYETGTANQGNIGIENINRIRLYNPPIEVQKNIVKMLSHKCSKIDSLITEKQSLIADLEAYKKSLIYEVVTGKRKVV